MKTLYILHKGWRANDTLTINEKGEVLLTYYTPRKTRTTTKRKGLFLYQNQRVFANENDARIYYMVATSKEVKE